jgi:transcriptional regulator with XRE-family HTH domain
MRGTRLSLREAGIQIGVSHMTVSRALRGEILELKNIESIANWLGVPPSRLIDLQAQDDQLAHQLSILLSTYPRIVQPAEEFIAKILDGSVQIEVLFNAFA